MLIPKPYLILGAALAVAAAVGTIAYQHRVINGLEAANAVLAGQVQDKDHTIGTLKDAAAGMIAASKAAEAALRAAGADVETLETQLAVERAKRRKATETDYALPDCQALLATDLARACPAHARSVRDAAAHH